MTIRQGWEMFKVFSVFVVVFGTLIAINGCRAAREDGKGNNTVTWKTDINENGDYIVRVQSPDGPLYVAYSGEKPVVMSLIK